MHKEHRVYISGPMTGLPENNYPAFFEMEKQLINHGYCNISNPARSLRVPEMTPWTVFMREALQEMLQCQACVFLPGWENSRGARLELKVAQDLDLELFDHNLQPCRITHQETVCEEADRLVSHDRGKDYGHPLDDFGRTGKIWGAILEEWKKSPPDTPVPPETVGLCMIGVKISREVNEHKRDNLVDIPGYSKCVDMIHDERSKRLQAKLVMM